MSGCPPPGTRNMNTKYASSALAALMATLAVLPAYAQQPSKPIQQAERPAAAARDMDPNTLVNGALQIAQLVDFGKTGEVWDGASAVAKKSVDRKKFVDGIDAQRKPRGAVAGRRWTSVNRHFTQGTKELPAGAYANVEFDTLYAGNKVGHELVSFRLDEDGTWRLSGYVIK